MQVSFRIPDVQPPAAVIDPVAQPPAANAANNRILSSSVKTLNEAGFAGADREFAFSIDPKTKRGVVRIVDSGTHELIEQIPNETVLAVARQLGSK